MPDTSSRRLAAILFADIVGYTTLMQQDEEAALEKLTRFKQTLETKTAEFQGQIIQYYGDGCLVVFDSPTDAVACSKALQGSFQADNLPVRIGIHLGEVVFKEGNVFGDSVNIASRIESLGVAGTVLFSEAVWRQIKKHPEFRLASLGSFEFKNVGEPVEVFALANEGFPVPKREEMEGKLKAPAMAASAKPNIWKKWAWAAGITVVSLAGWLFLKNHVGGKASSEAYFGKSVAVLPFKNLSGNPENQYFCDGMMDAVLSHLSKIATLRVISRTSMETYRQTDKPLPQIAEELKVSHLLEGSVQRSGNSVKIILQLIRANDDRHVWSGEFTRNMEDVFALQSELAQIVAKELNATISASESQRIRKAPTHNLEAYDALLRAEFACLQYMHDWKATDNDYHYIIALCDKALQLDPSMGKVYVVKGWAYWRRNGGNEFWEERFLDSVYIFARKALEMDRDLADAQALLGDYFSSQKNLDSAVFHTNQALQIDPNNFYAHFVLGSNYVGLSYSEGPDSTLFADGIALLTRASELEPFSPMMGALNFRLSNSYCIIGDFENAILYGQKMIESGNSETEIIMGYNRLSYAHLLQGNFDRALEYAQQISVRTAPGCPDLEGEINVRFLGDWQKGASQLECVLKEKPDVFMGRQSLAFAYWNLGRKKEAKKLFNEFLAQCEKLSKLRGHLEYYDVAAVYAVLGDKEKAYQNLRKLDEIGWWWWLPWYVQHDRMFENLWQDEEFKNMVRRATDLRLSIRERMRIQQVKG